MYSPTREADDTPGLVTVESDFPILLLQAEAHAFRDEEREHRAEEEEHL